jgi:alanyl-tRNA synthetase
VPTIDDGARAFAQSFVDRGRAVFAAVCRKPPSLLFTASADSGINAGALVKAALEKHGGRGGGSQKMAQGTVPRESDLEAILILLGFPVNATQS